MKTYITLFLLCISTFGFAQKDKEKIAALRIAHITNELNLTTEEAQQFWPIYNKFEAQKAELRKSETYKKIRKEKLEELSEKESKTFIADMLKAETKKLDHRKAFLKELSKVLSAKKIIKFIHSERSFKLKMLREYKGRMRGGRH